MKSPLQIIILRQFLALALLILLCFGIAEAQTPIIRSVTPSKGSMGETVSISGNNFGIDMSKLTVFFGASQATILSATDQLIEVAAPAGATYRNISVTRSQLAGPGLTGYSNEQFLLSFGGTHPFNTANLEAQKDFSAESGLYDLCLCDFNGDKKIDIATANKGSNSISILINNSSPGTVAYPPTAPATATPILVPIGSKTLHVTCGDLNGDGKPDIVATSGDPFSNNRIFILQNMGGGLFTPQTINLNIAGTQKVKIADLDLDGLPDLVVTHKNGPPSNLSLLKNLSTTAAILFDSPIDLAITGASTSDALDIADLNGDLLPEIIIGQSISKDLFILKNKSTTGALSFETPIKLTVGNTLINLRIGDLDNDGKSDIGVVDAVGAVYALLNQSSGTTLGFSAPVPISTDATSWGLDFGDLDGDGKADIVVTSVANARLTILNNESIPGTLSFLKTTISTSNFTRHVSIGDVDNDGKPDIAFTVEGASPKVAIFRNKACMIPEITPDEPINVCQNATLKLYTAQSGGATYVWKNVTAGGTTVGTNDPFFSVPTGTISTTTYSVTVQQPGLTCPSTQVSVNIGSGSGSADFTSPTPTGPVCTGSTLTLAVTPQPGKTFEWRGPNNFTASTNVPSVVIADFQAVNAGKYFVDVVEPSTPCIVDKDTVLVEAIDAQNFTLQYSGPDLICQGDKKILQINPTSTTFTFEWYKNSVLMGGKTKDTLHVYSTGEYFAKVTVPNCGSPKQTNTQKIAVASKPNVNFSFIPATAACSGQDIQFTDLTTNLDPALDVIYKWNFDVVGGSGTSTEKNPKHKYITAVTKTYSIKLGVSYRDNVCYQETQSPFPQITINPAPPVVITSTNHPDFKFCKGEKIELKVSGTFTNYKWSTGAEGADVSSIEVEESGLYSVEVTTAECTLNDDQTVTAIEPEINISATPPLINEGQSSQLSAEGLQNYIWSPSEALSDPSISNPIASPLVTTSYTVSGQDENGCIGSATVVVEVKGEPIVNKLKPFNFFSPNGDGPNEVWTIDKIQDYPQCNVVVYDQKGIKVFESKPYNNDWDGTFHGKKLPEGVYYYVIRCDGEENKTRNGSITLLR